MGVGFKTVSNHFEHEIITVKRNDLMELFNIYREEFISGECGIISPRIIRMMELRFRIMSCNKEIKKDNINATFNDGVQKISLYKFILRDVGNDDIEVETWQLKFEAELANPYVIITETESESIGPFRSSSTYQYIKYLPATLQNSHIWSVVFMNSALFNIINDKYLEPPPVLDQLTQ